MVSYRMRVGMMSQNETSPLTHDCLRKLPSTAFMSILLRSVKSLK